MACFNIRGALFVSLIVIIVFLCQTCLCFNLDGSPGSYAKFDHWEPCINGSLSFEFKTDRPNALLFYIDDGHSSFFELKLVGGIARLRLNLGGGTVILSAGQSLNDQQWHKVEIRRNGEQTTLTVDKIEHTRTLHGNEFDLNSTDDRYFFIGGLPDDYDQKLTTLALPSVIFEPKFRGSIRNLFYSSCAGPVERPTMINHDGILSSDEDLCERGNPCLNGGMCLTTDDGLMCDCTRIEFDGDRCETEKIPSDATFLGAQYFSYDLSSRGDPIISNNDQLTLDFRTKQSNGLLFFTGDSNDYLNVAMKDGGIILTINLGSGSYETEVRPGHVRFDDNRWHHLLIKREAREISMEVDGVYRKSGSTTGEFTLLSSSVLYVAGSPNTVLLPGSRVKSNFKGCMRKVRYQADNVQLDLTDLAKKSHGLISVVGEVLFNRCQELVESHPITFLTPTSYITLPTWDVSLKRASIAFQFQTTEPNGVILYNSGQLAKSDFFAIELLDGHLYLVINLGSGTMKVKASKQPVNDGEPHEVYLDYQGPQGYITLDGQKEPYTSKEKGDLLQLDGYLFVGAINDHVDASTLPKEMWSGMLGHGYVGCFQDLVINGNKVDLVAAATLQLAEGIAEYCRRMEPQCLSYPCMHQGICVEGWNRFVCDCRATGFIDNVCQTASTTLRYDGTQYVKVTMPEESLTEAEDISLRFRTMHPNGLLFMTSSDKTTDVMELYLDSGSIKLNVDVGSGAKSLTVGNVLNDDRWHTVFIKRRAQTIELAIDGHRPVTEKLPGQENTLSTRYIVLGYKDRVIPGDLPGEADELEFRNIDLGQEMKDDNSVGDHSGFIGSMQQLMFNQNYFFELAKSGRIENIEVTAKFSTDDYVVRDPVTFKAASAFATLPCLHAYKKFSLSFQFKTTEDSGLVLFNSGRGQDFFAIELNGGYLYYIYNMGAGAQSIQINSNQKLNNNKWHEVRLLRPELHKQLIRVDDNTPTVDNLGGSQALHFDLEGSLFVGGVRKTMYHSLPKVITSRHGFLGCLGSLDLNGYLPNLVKEADTIHQSIVEGCKGPTTQCQPDSCANDGRCVQQWNSYVCDCDSTSYSGPTCSDESTSYRFGPTEGLLTFSYPAYQQPNTVGDNLALGFTTYSKDAVLVRIDSENFDDYIEMELVNGNIFVVYNMGTADHPIGELFKPVNDGKYHVVRFTRSGPNATIQVDDLIMQTKNPRGQQLGVFNNQAFVYVGGKKTEDGVIARPFEGTISGLVMNGIRILDLAEADDSRITKEKSVYLEHSGAISARKKITKEILPNKDVTEMQSTMGLRTTPKLGVTDDIIFSGAGAGCHSDDEDDCTSVGSGIEDDIITPTVIIKTTPHPPTTTPRPRKRPITCVEPDCNSRTKGNGDIFGPTPDPGYTDYRGVTPVYGMPNSLTPTGETSKESVGSGIGATLNIGLIIGIAAGVLVALLILIFALYKFRTRSEGTYKVDESQNFSYLESKKQQGNGALLGANENNKRGGKKKDVKEWYV
ncbi:neurexin-3 isoform X2 [Patella vulgata]|uniref:neurexin-3 isoform X2 n=1 Tax=Patella vulgata TaxID=6465 RepID=UPI00217F9361|nr:neurexin-3 isoform X2 [Patella vulgata]